MREILVSKVLDRSMWLTFTFLFLGFIAFGCGGKVEQKTLEAENPEEIVDANQAMEDYMKSQSK